MSCDSVCLFIISSEKFTTEPRLLLGVGRIYDLLNDQEKAVNFYKRVLALDSSNVESIACLGAHYYYTEQVHPVLFNPTASLIVTCSRQPELSIRYYRRLLQMGVNNAELWNNLGLCCFYSGQYDMSLTCFDRSISLASDDELADIWYAIYALMNSCFICPRYKTNSRALLSPVLQVQYWSCGRCVG